MLRCEQPAIEQVGTAAIDESRDRFGRRAAAVRVHGAGVEQQLGLAVEGNEGEAGPELSRNG